MAQQIEPNIKNKNSTRQNKNWNLNKKTERIRHDSIYGYFM